MTTVYIVHTYLLFPTDPESLRDKNLKMILALIFNIKEHYKHRMPPNINIRSYPDRVFHISTSLPKESGNPVCLSFDAKDAGKGVLTAKVPRKSAGPISIEVKQKSKRVNAFFVPLRPDQHKSQNEFDVLFVPPQPDLYTVDVFWSDKPVKDSPFTVDTRQSDLLANVTCGELLFNLPGKPASLTADTSKAGPGTLTAKCQGEKSNEVPIKVTATSENIYDVSFTPEFEDIYTLSIFYDGTEVNSSPFTADLRCYPDRVKHIGTSLPDEAEVSAPVSLSFDTKEAGRGVMGAKVSGDSVGTVPAYVEETAPDEFIVTFVSLEADLYSVEVLWSEKQVKDSPFEIDLRSHAEGVVHTGTSLPEEAEAPIVLSFNAKEAGRGLMSAKTAGKLAGQVSTDVMERAPKEFSVAFTPPQPDLYTVDVLWSNQPVKDSPFTVDTRLPVYPENVTCGELLFTLPGKPASLTVDASTAGPGTLTAKCRGEKSGDTLNIEVTTISKNAYSISFKPMKEDIYTLSVFFDDKEVKDSPFTINLLSYPDRVEHTGSSLPEESGDPIALFFDAKDAGRGSASAKAAGESVGPIPVDVKETLPNFSVEFAPPKPDLYTIDVFWSNRPVKSSPFVVDTRPPTRPENVECGDLIFSLPGKPASLVADASTAGPGTLTANCRGQKSGEVPVEVDPTADGEFNISFLPKKEDIYTLSVFYNSTEVRDSPFIINLHPEKPAEEVIEMPVFSEMPVESFFIPGDFDKAATEQEKTEEPLTLYIGDSLTLKVDAEDEEHRRGELVATASGKRVDTGDEKRRGELVATASGEETGPAKVEISRDEDDIYTVFFNPDEPDLYTFNITLNGESVPSSPFLVKYISLTDPSKCHIFGLPDIPPAYKSDEEICFGVDAQKAGEGKLLVTADGPSNRKRKSKIKIQSSEENPAIYNITYIPTAPGLHRVHIHWADTPIPGSPVTFQVGDGRPLQSYAYGEPVSVEVFSTSRIAHLQCYAVHEETGHRHDLNMNKMHKSSFEFIFQEPGFYWIHIQENGKEIPGSPYRIRYANPPNPGACKVIGLDSKGFLAMPINFFIDCSEAESGSLLVKAIDPSETGHSNLAVTAKENKMFSVQYTPNSVGVHQFDITWDETPIPGSPFHITIFPDVRTVLKGENNVNIISLGESAEVKVSNIGKHEGDDLITAYASGEKSGEAEVAVNKEEDTYIISFSPTAEDDYTFEVKMNKDHIEGSPFFIKAVEKHSLAKDFIHPEGVCHSDVEVGQSVNLIVRTDEAETATELTILNESSDGECETRASDEVDGMCGLSFLPLYPGDYLVHVKAKDAEISGSPFKITVAGKQVGLLKNPSESQKLGHPVQFHVSAVHAGTGNLRITSTGPGKAEVKVIDNKDGVYTCEFNPTIAGKYHLNILWNRKHIQGSPYLLNFLSSHKSLAVFGLELEHVDFHVGVPYMFSLNCEEVGQGILKITCRPQNAAKINVTPVGAHNHYQCEIIPLKRGIHQISMQYNDKHILKSPFNVQFYSNSSKCQVIQKLVKPQSEGVSKVQLCVSTEGAGEGELEASVRDVATKELLTIDISKSTENEKHYMLEFSIKHGMECLVSITYDQLHIPKSPFKLSYADPQGAACCHAEGEGLSSVQVGKWSQFIVSTAGPGELSVNIEKEGNELEPTLKRTSPLSDNQYEVSYLPTSQGLYTVSVVWEKGHIPGSPFKVCCHNSDSTPILSQFTTKAEKANEEQEVHVTLQPLSGIISGQVTKGRNESCTVYPPESGKNTIHEFWNGEDTQMNVKSLTCPQPKNRAYGPGLDEGYVGQEGNFTVETGGGGAGTLTVDVQGPKGAFKIHMRHHPDNDRTVLVRYNPVDTGSYVIDVLWSGVHISGSPFKVNITEQERLVSDIGDSYSYTTLGNTTLYIVSIAFLLHLHIIVHVPGAFCDIA